MFLIHINHLFFEVFLKIPVDAFNLYLLWKWML